ncbi:unnamed protein product [Acanthoscelides obtectus]|uniref:Uncharacterized protein n=1 Tax=Acanthoscelides obtectus TaxID=200917 RepID=A0A9P0L9I3_ACAOB|nr:unnamed protein product [Acanthoscelides obtectus]CAK1681039.1 hypothetical protein AOBTE_LOCUS32990 [Acanthoscelides obtectus]
MSSQKVIDAMSDEFVRRIEMRIGGKAFNRTNGIRLATTTTTTTTSIQTSGAVLRRGTAQVLNQQQQQQQQQRTTRKDV